MKFAFQRRTPMSNTKGDQDVSLSGRSHSHDRRDNRQLLSHRAGKGLAGRHEDHDQHQILQGSQNDEKKLRGLYAAYKIFPRLCGESLRPIEAQSETAGCFSNLQYAELLGLRYACRGVQVM